MTKHASEAYILTGNYAMNRSAKIQIIDYRQLMNGSYSQDSHVSTPERAHSIGLYPVFSCLLLQAGFAVPLTSTFKSNDQWSNYGGEARVGGAVPTLSSGPLLILRDRALEGPL